QLHPLADDAALALLIGGESFASAADFGRRCGWNRQKASRRLKEWSDAGHLKLEKRHGKTAVVTAKPACPLPAVLSASVSADTGHDGTEPRTPPKKRDGKVTCILAAVLLAVLGVTIASFLVAVNWTSWTGFVRNAQAWYISYGFGVMGVTISFAV